MVSRLALVKGGVVVNVTLGDDDVVALFEADGFTVVNTDGVNVSPGDTYANGVFAGAASPVRTIDAIWEDVKVERDRRKNGGFLVVDKWFHSDQESLTRYLGLISLGENLPPRNWKTMDGTFVPMTPTLAAQVFAGAVAHDGACFDAAEAHRAALWASPDPSAHDIYAEWPLVYSDVTG